MINSLVNLVIECLISEEKNFFSVDFHFAAAAAFGLRLSLIPVPSLLGVALISSATFTLKKAVGLGAIGSPAGSISTPVGTIGTLISPSITPVGST